LGNGLENVTNVLQAKNENVNGGNGKGLGKGLMASQLCTMPDERVENSFGEDEEWSEGGGEYGSMGGKGGRKGLSISGKFGGRGSTESGIGGRVVPMPRLKLETLPNYHGNFSESINHMFGKIKKEKED
jgi:hypothetical protein